MNKMKTTFVIISIILICTSCIQKPQKYSSSEIFSCGPNDFPSILVKRSLSRDIEKYDAFFLQFNDSLKTRDLPIVFRQLTCINECEQKIGISFFETKPDYIDCDYLNLWILVNYEDNELGIHIDTLNLRDSLNKVLAIKGKRLSTLCLNVTQNPEADSLADDPIIITLNVRAGNNKQLSRDDFNKLIEYMSVMTRITSTRADELSLKLWKKSYNHLEMRQKIAVCRLLGYILIVNIT